VAPHGTVTRFIAAAVQGAQTVLVKLIANRFTKLLVLVSLLSLGLPAVASADYSTSLLDSLSTAADVMSAYQTTVANESYLGSSSSTSWPWCLGG
jgi:hypothetical protein